MSSGDLAYILERRDPVAIIGEHMALRQTGKTYKGLCPFHAEKTPSFNLNPDRGLWYCFGCAVGGNLITFVMKVNHFSFPEAKEWLARKAGVTLSAEQDVGSRKRGRLHDILKKTADFYHQMLLKSVPGEQGLSYLQSRGVHSSMLERF